MSEMKNYFMGEFVNWPHAQQQMYFKATPQIKQDIRKIVVDLYRSGSSKGHKLQIPAGTMFLCSKNDIQYMSYGLIKLK